ncbi:protein kinase [Candidatus Micrarchaeota archaeon]|nr:protein kinase [Candidatus Micrarchaeota archaeon]MBU1682021.1 protein kinase [Candidatus Micrarchaeota archaeon]
MQRFRSRANRGMDLRRPQRNFQQIQQSQDPIVSTIVRGRSERGARKSYRVVDILGKGGMGSVYLAYDEKGEKVALKLSNASITDGDSATRFFREIKSNLRIKHPNVIRTLDYELYKEQPFCIIEFLDGQDLSEKLKANGGGLSWNEVKSYLVQLCDGLGAAHARGIIHRDLKPGNIFITKEGVVKILDFGLAKRLTNGADEATHGDELTRTGTIMGTINYMAPEQTLGKKDAYDHRADLYSVGIIMYKLLTGDVPFKGENLLELIESIKNDAPKRPSEIKPDADITPGIEAVILKAIRKNPRDRFQSAEELKAAIIDTEVFSDQLENLLLLHTRESTIRPSIHPEPKMTPEKPDSRQIPTERVVPERPATIVSDLGKETGGLRDEEIPQVKAGSWLKRIIVVGALAAIAGAGYYYRDEIKHRIDPVIDQIQRRVEDRQEPVQQPVQSVNFRARIETTPTGADVFIEKNRRFHRIGNTENPLELMLERKEHRLVIRKRGYRDERISISPDDATASIRLSPVRRRQRRSAINIDETEIEAEEDN